MATVQRNPHCEIVESEMRRGIHRKKIRSSKGCSGEVGERKKKQQKNKMICFLMREREPDNCISISFFC